MRSTILIVLSVVGTTTSALLANGPKAYVITGWNTGDANRQAHEKIAAEAKKDLEDAGYKVTQILEATKAQVKDAIQDPDAQALVLIDHGTTGQARVRCKDNNGNPERVTGAQFAGPFNNFKAVTIHACDQNQDGWKNIFPNADFHSWTGSIYASDELEWQKNKKYRRASEPSEGEQTEGEIADDLEAGHFPTAPDGTVAPDHDLSGNWPMDPPMAMIFGTQVYNMIVFDEDPTSDDLLFSAVVEEGQVISYKLAQFSAPPTFNIYMPHEFWVAARNNPHLMMDPTILGTIVQIQPIRTTVPPQMLLAGVARNIFRVPFEPTTRCVADYNQDGGIDGSDVEAFFRDWEAGDAAADVNQDGGVDGGDVETFFSAWEMGLC